jgi:hypothetical protein
MRKRSWRRGRVLVSKPEILGSRPGDVDFEIIQFYRRSSTFVKVCRNSSIFIVKFSVGMSKTFFDTCVFWSCVTRCRCRTTSSTLFTVFPHIWGSPSSYMTLQLLHSKFPYIWGKFYLIFYQCTVFCQHINRSTVTFLRPSPPLQRPSANYSQLQNYNFGNFLRRLSFAYRPLPSSIISWSICDTATKT